MGLRHSIFLDKFQIYVLHVYQSSMCQMREGHAEENVSALNCPSFYWHYAVKKIIKQQQQKNMHLLNKIQLITIITFLLYKLIEIKT